MQYMNKNHYHKTMNSQDQQTFKKQPLKDQIERKKKHIKQINKKTVKTQ